jgi:hypothetical protein
VATVVWIILMRFIHLLSISCLTFIVLLQPGCSGSDFPGPNSSTVKITYFDKKHVVSGTVYGDGSKRIAAVFPDVETGPMYPKEINSYSSGNRFAFEGYSSEKPNKGHVFSVKLSDESLLYSVWNGTETAVADIAVTEDRASSDIKYSLSVGPEEPAATFYINPVTNLAFWLWQSNILNPVNNSFSYYLGNVFQFLMSQFPLYNLPIQNAVTDNPSPELLHLLDDYSITVSDPIKVSGNNSLFTRFTLTRKATGQIVCTGLFTTFPACQ